MKKLTSVASVLSKLFEIFHWIGSVTMAILLYPDGTINEVAVRIFSIGAVIIFSLMAIVFRNVYLSLKTAQGETKFAEGDTPSQKSIVRMIREMGIFSLLVPIVGLAFSTLAAICCTLDCQPGEILEYGGINSKSI